MAAFFQNSSLCCPLCSTEDINKTLKPVEWKKDSFMQTIPLIEVNNWRCSLPDSCGSLVENGAGFGNKAAACT